MNLNSIQAFPLHWPPGRPRTKFPRSAKFYREVSRNDGSGYKDKQKLGIADSRDRVFHELRLLGTSRVIISSNLRLRLDGLPAAGQPEPNDSGVAIYFELKKQPHCLSCDTWCRAADNLAAISKHVEAMRGQLRWGAADIATMFAGFKALPNAIVTPAPMTVEEAAAFISKYDTVSADFIIKNKDAFTEAYRSAAASLHPDRNNGQTIAAWHQMQAAKSVLDQHHGAA